MKNIFILISTILVGCSTQNSLEKEVINATFMDMVGTQYYKEPLPIPPYRPIHPDSISNEIEGDIELAIEFEGETYEPKDSLALAKERTLERNRLLKEYTSFDWDKYKKDSIEWYEQLNNIERDKRNIVLLVNDSLINPNLDYLDLTFRLTEVGFQTNIQLEESWRQLMIQLVESNFESKHLKFEEFTNIGEYQLQPMNFEPTEQDRVVAILTFSRIVFNENKTKACFYYKEYCGSDCGYGYMVFVERINGKWNLKAKSQLWIS
ncbi:MAG: hypothetical protein Q8S14_06320 [Algoriphagus sp.]|uniref:hypothetical protein n=1 Tax=Algoriphagus sp. TaxID=1872435 RepID=UPI00273137E2|nr:hypothetical protein [Algoriphagus sp.]MDP2041320.1 hypothetical protein [Algoriphagus sp.]MDP3471471.1 hypothetical protein [Algoriphagus sp.]